MLFEFEDERNISNLYNIEFNHMYVNIDKKFEYYVSDEPVAKALCRH